MTLAYVTSFFSFFQRRTRENGIKKHPTKKDPIPQSLPEEPVVDDLDLEVDLEEDLDPPLLKLSGSAC